MNPAITVLESSLHALENNEPIQRSDGRIEQADASAKQADQIRKALAILRAANETKGGEGGDAGEPLDVDPK